MKNEKEIEYVYSLYRASGGYFKQVDKVKRQITDRRKKYGNISVSWPQVEIENQGHTYKKF